MTVGSSETRDSLLGFGKGGLQPFLPQVTTARVCWLLALDLRQCHNVVGKIRDGRPEAVCCGLCRPPEYKWLMRCAVSSMTWKWGSAPRRRKSRRGRRLSSSASVQTKSALLWRKAKRFWWEMLEWQSPTLSSTLCRCFRRRIAAMPCTMQALRPRSPKKKSWCFSCGKPPSQLSHS